MRTLEFAFVMIMVICTMLAWISPYLALRLPL